MQLFDIIAVLIAITAVCSYLNHRILRLDGGVGVMLISLLVSLLIIALGKLGLGLGIQHSAKEFMGHIEFGDALLHWMLGFLLFAGAITVDLDELMRQRGITGALSLFATIASMFLIAGLAWVLRMGLSFPYCLLLGALISPTDPVAVLGLVRRMSAPKRIETIIAGEALFNDGIGVVLFLTLLNYVRGSGPVSSLGISILFIRQFLGGIGLGLIFGLVVYRLLKRAHNFELEVLLTLSLVMGCFSLADLLGVSGPIAVVVAGLLIGNRGRTLQMPADTVRELNASWALIDEVLNTVLFVLIGMEILVMPFKAEYLLSAVLAIPAFLLARWLSVTGTLRALRVKHASRGAME
jgi:CPA1 family monovalent cation:H+ antiporter